MKPIVNRVLTRHRQVVLMLAAVLCGGVAVYAGSHYLHDQIQAERLRLTPPPQEMVDVVVAKESLDKGDEVSTETMAIRSMPAQYVPVSAVTPSQFESLVGQRLLQPLQAGEMLVASEVSSADLKLFSSRVRPGIRAMTIAVDEINSLSGMLQPGDHIDLLMTARPPTGPGQREADHEVTVPLLQNLLVMATGRRVRAATDDGGDPSGYSAVTVEVSPAQAARLVVAQRAGRLTAVLRNPDDGLPVVADAVDLSSLFPVAPPPASAPARRRFAGTDRRPQMIVGGLGKVLVGRLPTYNLHHSSGIAPQPPTRGKAPDEDVASTDADESIVADGKYGDHIDRKHM